MAEEEEVRHEHDRPSVGTDDARDLSRAALRRREVLETAETGHEPEGRVVERQVLRIAHVQLDSGHAPCGKLDRRRRDIDADDVDTSVERAAKERPGAAGDVEHGRSEAIA